MSVYNKYFYKNKKSKLCFGGRFAVVNDLFYRYGESKSITGRQESNIMEYKVTQNGRKYHMSNYVIMDWAHATHVH
jgi:hypothetical protein